MPAIPERRPVPVPAADRAEALSRLRVLIADTGTAPIQHQPPADAPPIQVPTALRRLIRGGELQRGSVVTVRQVPQGSPSYLALALAAAASADGAWCGVLGMPSFGIAAAAGLGAQLSRFLMLDDPGKRWPDAVAIMASACDLVLWQPPHRVGAGFERRIRAKLRPADRERGAVLITTAEVFANADLTLSTSDPRWTGLGQGTGHLTGRQVTVTATGRAAAGHGTEVRLWLPAHDGTLRLADAEQAEHLDLDQSRHLRPA